MALHVNEKPAGQPTKNATATGPQAEQTQSIGFGTHLGLMKATSGSEFTNAIASEMTKAYAELKDDLRVMVMDRDQYTNLSYSVIVVAMKAPDKSVCYHIVTLEATGAESLRAAAIVSEATRAMHERKPANIFTPSDALNGILDGMVLELLVQHYPETEFISTDGVVIKNTNVEVTDLGRRAAMVAYNAVVTEGLLSSGERSDLNLDEAMRKRKSNLRIEQNLYNTTVEDLVGAATRQDFKIDLVDHVSGQSFEQNAYSGTNILSVGGFVDAIRGNVAVQTQPGFPAINLPRLHPNIVISNVETVIPTTGFMLLGLVTATVMGRNDMWLQSLASINPKSPNTPGALNLLTNIEGNDGGAGTELDFSTNEVTEEEHYAALTKMYTLAPVISYDIEVFGPQTYYAGVVATAADPVESPARRGAREELVESCHQLTGGVFPKDYSHEEIFVTEGIVIPTGYWMDKSGERDIRDVDLAFVANQTHDINTVNKWGMTVLPKRLSGLDPFLTRVEIISQLIPDAVINGKAVRVTFTDKFLSTLTNSCQAAGLDAVYEPTMVVNQQYSATQFTDYLAAAGLSNAGGFARQAGYGNQMAANTPYAYMGHMGYAGR